MSPDLNYHSEPFSAQLTGIIFTVQCIHTHTKNFIELVSQEGTGREFHNAD